MIRHQDCGHRSMAASNGDLKKARSVATNECVDMATGYGIWRTVSNVSTRKDIVVGQDVRWKTNIMANRNVATRHAGRCMATRDADSRLATRDMARKMATGDAAICMATRFAASRNFGMATNSVVARDADWDVTTKDTFRRMAIRGIRTTIRWDGSEAINDTANGMASNEAATSLAIRCI